jgi:hypothetical protein
MSEEYKWRDKSKIHTSYHTYELLLVSLQNRRYYQAKQILKDIAEDTKEIGEALRQRCLALSKLPDARQSQRMSLESEYPFCIINDLERIDRLWKLSKSAKGFIADSAWEQLEHAEKFWNHEWRKLDCAYRIEQGHNRTACFCFGTIDLLDIIPTPSSLWANFFRMKLAEHPGVSGLLSYPMHLVKRVREINPNPLSQYCCCSAEHRANREVKDLNRIVPERKDDPRFVLYTFIHRPPDWDREKKKEFLERAVDFLLEARFGDGDCRPQFARKHDQYLRDHDDFPWRAKKELFMTFSSTFPLVLKSEMQSLKDASVYLSILAKEGEKECNFPLSTSSIVGWYDSFLLDPDAGQPAFNPQGVSTHPERFQLYLKVTKTGVGDEQSYTRLHRVVKNVLALLDQVGLKPFPPGKNHKPIRKREKFVIYKRFYFWDYLIVFQTQNISRLVHFLIDEVPRLRDIEHSATIPLWRTAGDPDPIYPTSEDFVLIDPALVPDPASDHQKEPRDSWKDLIEVVPQIDNFLSSGPGGGNQDLFDNMINWNLDMLSQQYRWLISYISQMEKSWESQVQGTQAAGKNRKSTFQWLRKHLESNLYSLLVLANPATYKFYTNSYIWLMIQAHRERLDSVKKLIVWIASEYNERTEGAQAVTLTEHFVKVGEQTGVMDMYIDAADRLFRHYCSKPKINARTRDIIWNELFRDYHWKGISSSSSGEELEIIPMFEILFLPVDFKFNTIGSLLPIAHEAAHQVLFWIDPDPDSELGKKLAGKNSGLKSFGDEVWMPMLKATFEHAEANNADPARLKNALISPESVSSAKSTTSWKDLETYCTLEPKSPRKQLHYFEFLADVMGLLSAGPALLRGLMFLYRYLPSFSPLESPVDLLKGPSRGGVFSPGAAKAPGLSQVHPPTWLRIAYLHLICQRLKWIEDDLFKIEAMVRNHFREYEIRDGKNLGELLFDFDIDKFPEKLDGLLTPEEKTLEYYFYTGMRQDTDNSFIYNLLRWIQLYGDYSLFYPFPLKDDFGSPEATREAKTKYPDVIALVNQYTAQIGDRLIYNDEVVTDAPLRYIAAAAMLPGLNHPSNCMGRIIHSLYYSHREDSEFISELRRRTKLDFV